MVYQGQHRCDGRPQSHLVVSPAGSWVCALPACQTQSCMACVIRTARACDLKANQDLSVFYISALPLFSSLQFPSVYIVHTE